MGELTNVIKDEVTMLKTRVEQDNTKLEDKINNISEAVDEGLRETVDKMSTEGQGERQHHRHHQEGHD